jgi:hypothetical protein
MRRMQIQCAAITMKGYMKIKLLLLLTMWFSLTTLHAEGVWDIANNRVTYSVFQDNIVLGDKSKTTIDLSRLNLAEVATQEGRGASQDYLLTSAVLAINGTVYGSIYYKNKSSTSTEPTFKISGYSDLKFGTDVTEPETYFSNTSLGTMLKDVPYNKVLSVGGAPNGQSMTIVDDLARFVGTGNIQAVAAFPVDAYFTSYGTDYESVIQMKGKADISVTYNYEYVPEPTGAALLSIGSIVIALRRKRVAV